MMEAVHALLRIKQKVNETLADRILNVVKVVFRNELI